MDENEVELSCGVCGQEASYLDCSPATAELLIMTWKREHSHTVGELKMYHDAEVARAEYYARRGYDEEES